MAAPADVTILMQKAGAGDKQSAEALLPLVYDQLRKVAQERMNHERADHTLEATALVHEAYARLAEITPRELEATPLLWSASFSHRFAELLETPSIAISGNDAGDAIRQIRLESRTAR